ncbi:phasin family protein [Mesorhizobium sp. 1B3]|uniref:phasin family protein n=1 Tax=Mesorhizobium sp. 1B3 TaxID=3243599 RepID=UPI003D955CB4
MTKTSAKTNGASGSFASIQDALDNIQTKLEVPAAARDFVKRTAASARERAETAHSGAADLTEGVEKFAVSMAGGYAKLTRGLLDLTLANVQHSLSTVEKLAGAKSVNEAVQLQADFIRDNAQANFDHVRNAAEDARTTLAHGAQAVQTEIFKLYGGAKAA